MKTVDLVAPLTRGGRDFAPGETLDLPPALAGKMVNRGRAKVHDRVVAAYLPPPAKGGAE